MPFQKGNTFGKGRVKGSKNKVTKDIKERLLKLVSDNMEDLQFDLDHLEPRDRVNAIVQLINYTQPKLKSVEGTVTSVTDLSDKKIAELERMQELVKEIEAEKKLTIDIKPEDDE